MSTCDTCRMSGGRHADQCPQWNPVDEFRERMPEMNEQTADETATAFLAAFNAQAKVWLGFLLIGGLGGAVVGSVVTWLVLVVTG